VFPRRDESGLSNDLVGIGIYPIETLKTQMMSSTGAQKRTLASAAKRVWALGGFRAYYRGLGVRIRLCVHLASALKLFATDRPGRRIPVCVVASIWGVVRLSLIYFLRYSAIDMSTFEALKLAYVRSSGKDDPGMLALLAFGSISGSVGATMVYPLNLVRTRLQASGSSGHPERYSGIADVARKTYGRDGWRGFYRGLVPTLAKVSLLRPLNLSLF
jgi:solute carrier family 25 (mitochondrial phosphate transporter), member 23/24/25/41